MSKATLKNRQEEWERRECKRRAKNEKLTQEFAGMRAQNGLDKDPDQFSGIFGRCIEDWQDSLKKSDENKYVWRGPTGVFVSDIIQEGNSALSREPLYLLERCLNAKEFPEVTEIRRSEGFGYCLGQDDDSHDDELKCLDVEEGRAYMVSVETIPSGNSSVVDAFTLLTSNIDSKTDDCSKAAMKALEPLLRGKTDAVLINYSGDNRICDWDEGTYYPSAMVLLFEHSGQCFSLVVAAMGWRYEWQDY
ncbi:hypothetical protein ACHAWF_001770 [Thalassiosira exigua]